MINYWCLLSRGFIKGFVDSYSTLLQVTSSIIFDNFDEKDIIDLKLDFGEVYCKLIEDNKKLKLVKEKYRIDSPILPYMDKLNHIAFDEPFYNYLKNLHSCNY